MSLPSFPSFDLHSGGSLATKWSTYEKRLDTLVGGMGIKDAQRKKSLLLLYVGEEVHELFDTLDLPNDSVNVYEQAKSALHLYFAPNQNREYEVFKFRQAKQDRGESLDTYHVRLRKLAVNCGFVNRDGEIVSQIIQSCSSSTLRRRVLREKDITLSKLLDIGRSYEISDEQAVGIEKELSQLNVNKIAKPKSSKDKSERRKRDHCEEYGKRERRDHREEYGKREKQLHCFNCGGEFPHKSRCPAEGKRCHNCKRENHFTEMCRSRKTKHRVRRDKGSPSSSCSSERPRKSKHTHGRVRHVKESSSSCSSSDQSDSESDDSEYALQLEKKHNKQPKSTINVMNTRIDMIVDTGASVNIIDEHTYRKLNTKPVLSKTDTKLYPYSSNTPISIKGTFKTQIESVSQNTTTTEEIYVVNGNYGCLLSYNTAVNLEIIPTIKVVEASSTDSIVDEFSDRFDGIGKIKDTQARIHIDPDVKPVVQQHRRIPFHMRKKVEAELRRLEELDIIEKVDGPTPWVSPVVVTPKPKNPEEIRLCIDMRLPNTAIQRERHITPTIDDIIVDLTGSTIFSKLDLNAGYHQLELEPESRYITTFTTHVGLRRYKRLNFGTSSASELFQLTIAECIKDIEGVKNISDDIIIYGKTQEEHDSILRQVFERLREKNITLNKSKCEFNKDHIEFFGYVFSCKGLAPDPKKVKVIQEASAPANASEVRSFLGLTNYLSRFIPDYATTVAPLLELTHKHKEWRWNGAEEHAFQTLKDKLTTNTIAYFDPHKHSEVIVDASPVGLCAMLVQDRKVVSYASKSLSKTERRYSQTEREALAIVWGCEHFHLFLLGANFTLVTDHKPLEVIFNNPKSKPPARIERWCLRLQRYDFTVKYRPGKDNPADYLSRHPSNSIEMKSHLSKRTEEYVSFLVNEHVPKSMSLECIANATRDDVVLQEVIANMKSDNWKTCSSNCKPFALVHNELTLARTKSGTVLLYDSRLIVPAMLQKDVVKIAHEGHQGIVKTKQLLREKVWFLGMNKMVESTCQECIPCMASTPTSQKEPPKMTVLPDQPWTHVSADFCGPFPTGEYLLVVIDDYSRYPVVEMLTTTSARAVIPHFRSIFSLFGIPLELKTDNGPPFQGAEFADFAKSFGFHHRKITPLWSQANGEAERFMKTLTKAVRTATADGLSWKKELHQFLMNYRTTPHCTTKIAPATALFGRSIRTKLPEYTKLDDEIHDIRQNDEKAKQKIKSEADKRNHARKSDLKVGDKVLVRVAKRNKLSTPFSPEIYEICDINGTQVTAEQNGHRITRNSSHFKKVKLKEE